MARAHIPPIVFASVPGRESTSHFSTTDTKPLRQVAVLLCTLLISTAARAEAQPRNYTCTTGEQTRSVELLYLAPPDTLPCEIRRSDNEGENRVIWRAQYDSGFCARQFVSYRNKLQGLGWQCESGGLSEPALGAVTPRLAVSEDTQATPALSISPEPPGKKTGNLTAEDIREMDDWLIYLSAQTMASIQQLSPDIDTFKDYQRQEQLDSDTIYERLQKRIEFLNRMVNPALSISTSDF